MIHISFKKGQGLGNQLWVYSAAKSIADKLNFKLKIHNFENFKGKDFLFLDYQHLSNSENNDSSKGNIEKFFHEFLYYDSKYKYILSGFDERIFNLEENTLIEGLFQSEKYFFGDLNKLKKYIKLKNEFIESNYISSDICILNIRGGESKRHKSILPKKYWENAMKNFQINHGIQDFKIVTDDPKYANYLFPNLEVIASAPDIEKCYSLIHNCSNIISSNSTFSYFPCKTGFKKNVIAPIYWQRPFNKDKRWFSPCNLYTEWQWQDEKGKLFSFEECRKSAKESEIFYTSRTNILVSKNEITNSSILSKIPNKYKKHLKKFLSYIFPNYVGNDPGDFIK